MGEWKGEMLYIIIKAGQLSNLAYKMGIQIAVQ